jgi:predicted ester cyclase
MLRDTITGTDRKIRARREEVVNAHIYAETSTHDIAATLATFRHPRYEVPAVGAIADGAEAVEGLLGQLLGAFPDFWLEKLALHHSDHAVTLECKFGGTHKGAWVGLAPTGKQMEVQAACIFVFDGEDLVCEKVYFDHATILRQLAA